MDFSKQSFELLVGVQLLKFDKMIGNALMAIAYALPFSVAGFFVLKNREVAA